MAGLQSEVAVLTQKLAEKEHEVALAGVAPWVNPRVHASGGLSAVQSSDDDLEAMRKERDRMASRAEQAKNDRNQAMVAKERVVLEAKKLQQYVQKLESELQTAKGGRAVTPPHTRHSLNNIFSEVEHIQTSFVRD